MTTDVFSATAFYQHDLGRTGSATNATVYANETEFGTTRVTNVQSKNATGSTTNPSVTFTSTPTNGNAMIAVLCRTADNVASTNADWTLLTSSGVSASRRIEFWWRRAGASESTTHTWTNSTAAAWDLTVIECGGWAAKADPVTTVTAGNVTGTGTTTGGLASGGNQASIGGVVTSNTISAMAFSANTAGQLKTTTLVASSTRTGVGFAGSWLNRTSASWQFTWTTSRAYSYGGVGWPQGTIGTTSAQVAVGNGANTSVNSLQNAFNFDTSSIADANTITSATLKVQAITSTHANSDLAFYDFASSSYAGTDNSDNWLFQWPSALSSLTKVASYSKTDPWSNLTLYNMTSTASFLTAINKTGTTKILAVTDDQVAGTTRATAEQYSFSVSSLTVVHNLQASTTLPNVTTTMTPAISPQAAFFRTLANVTTDLTSTILGSAGYPRTIAASVTTIPAVARLIGYTRTLASSIDTTPIVNRVVALNVTITSTMNAIAGLFAARLIPQLPRIVRLGARSTIQLTQIVIARLAGRSTIRLPKE